MALHTRKQLAELCGLEWSDKTRPKIAMWIKRNNIIMSGEYVDDTIPQNADWILKQQESNSPKDIKNVSVDEPVIKVDKPVIKTKTPKVSEPEINEGGIYGIDKKLKVQELEKKQVETRILTIKEQKLIGEVIPTDIVKSIFTQHSQSIVTEFKNCIEDVLTIFGKRKGLNTNEIAEIRGSLTVSINVAVDKAVDMSKKNLNSIISEFSVKRDVGERE